MRSVLRGRYLVCNPKTIGRGSYVIAAILLGLLLWTIVIVDLARNFTAEVSHAGYVANVVRVLVSLVVGIGLMTIVFCRASPHHDRERGANLGDPLCES
jgi:uncharacterized protein YhhL (DUF1145 family)